ncbi:MAG: DUF3667 domain-containing protein [Gammaproteobacteria bacterium]|nr:DUF3667 domain-containing protein [Gammaproteobacteria bacterium]
MKSIVHDFLDTVFEYDSRIWRTLVPLYLLPGRITRDYLEGRRMRYVLPFRLFFVITVVTFLVLQWNLGDRPFDIGGVTPLQQTESIEELEQEYERMRDDLRSTREELEADPQRAYGVSGVIVAERSVERAYERRRDWLLERDAAVAEGRPPPTPPSRSSLELSPEDWLFDADGISQLPGWFPAAAAAKLEAWIERGTRNIARLEEEPDRLIRRFFGLLPPVLFVLMPVFALLLKFFYLFHGRLYMEHVVFGLHAHSFLGLAVLMGFALQGLHGWVADGWWVLQSTMGWLSTAAWWWIPIYLLLMQRHVYGQGWAMTIFKFLCIGLAYSIVLIVATVVAVVISVVTA